VNKSRKRLYFQDVVDVYTDVERGGPLVEYERWITTGELRERFYNSVKDSAKTFKRFYNYVKIHHNFTRFYNSVKDSPKFYKII
jgi:hypothetical protein